jgi:hypothetical protein
VGLHAVDFAKLLMAEGVNGRWDRSNITEPMLGSELRSFRNVDRVANDGNSSQVFRQHRP